MLSRHRLKEVAVEAGRAIARKLEVEHTIHRQDGVIPRRIRTGMIRIRPGTRRRRKVGQAAGG